MIIIRQIVHLKLFKLVSYLMLENLLEYLQDKYQVESLMV
ncbi:hypothetical protein SDC9_192365 [bioreactor metagenome]|uniref:Uncharacterized protein n=1 Tax=bioreactor metagenome TaxID=1076179 RepID=A0A645I0M0_9ZZZZ